MVAGRLDHKVKQTSHFVQMLQHVAQLGVFRLPPSTLVSASWNV